MCRLQRVTRFVVVTCAAALAVFSQEAPGRAADDAPLYEWLFVQSSTSGTFDGTRLTLDNVGPTIAFTDRPERVTGHLKTQSFVDQWGIGRDSFADDSPNASLSIYGKDAPTEAIVELRNPTFKAGRLSYEAKVLEGTVPAKFKESALFIDILGRGLALLGGAAMGSSEARSAEAAKPAPVPTAPATSPECVAAQQQLVAATTDDAVKLATEKVQALCPK